MARRLLRHLLSGTGSLDSDARRAGWYRVSMSPLGLPLHSARLILRRFQASDLEPLHAYRSDPENERYQGWSSPTLEEARRFVEEQIKREPGAPGVGVQIAIERKDTGAMIGDLFLRTPDNEPELATCGFTVARKHQGQGFATEAVETLLDAVFQTLGKHRVTAYVLAANTRSVALLERIGMRREAHHVRASRLDSEWVDDYVYAVLAEEWRAQVQSKGS